MGKSPDSRSLELKLLASCSVVVPRTLPLLADRSKFSGLCAELVTRDFGDHVDGTDLKFETPELATAFVEIVNDIMNMNPKRR